MKKFSSRIISIIALASVLTSLAGCVDVDSDSSKRTITSAKSDSSSVDDSKKSNESDSGSSKSDDSTEETEKAETASKEKLQIENQVLWESEGVKVTATGIDDDGIFGDEVNLLIENNSDKNIMLGCDALIVNDFMINDLFATSVAAGKKSNESLSLLSNELETAGIDNIGKIELYLHLTDDDSYETISSSDCITIATSESADADLTPEVNGFELYNSDGIRILGQYVNEDDLWGTAVMLYIENNTDKKISVHCDDLSINGFMVTSFFAQDLYPGKKAYSDITLLQSELDENKIEKVENVELKFRINDSDTYDTIAESGPVSFSVE